VFARRPPYPNPCRETLALPVATPGEIFDLTGKKTAVFASTNVLDTSTLRPGTYAVRTPVGSFVFAKTED
jgi:hypothetical protein